MAEIVFTLRLGLEWFAEPADCSECDCCNDIIVTNKNCLYLFLNNDLISDKPEFVLCDSCYQSLS